METVLLCDVLPDGTVAGVVLVEPIYDTNTGSRVGTRTVDPVTGAPYVPTGTLGPCSPDGCNATTSVLVLCDEATDGTATQFVRATTYDCEGALLATLDRNLDGTPYIVTGTVGVCPTSPDCESPTTPVTSVGLCLADGTPIAVTVVRDCTGAVTSEGWINLSTGAWSAGTVPAGTVACGESRSIQVSGTFCDVDDATGDVLGLVLVEYTYDDTGAVASVRLVDAVTGGTYAPTGTVTVCPAGVEQPERDILQLCDTATDGTVTPFVRDYARDEVGAIVGHSDYALDGTAYVPTGTVGVCSAAAEQPERDILQLCDTATDGTVTPFVRDYTRDEDGTIVGHSDYALDGTTYVPAGTVGVCTEPCRTTSLLTLCDTTEGGPIQLASRLSYTDVDPMPWAIAGGGVIHQPTLVSGQPFWDGDTVVVAPPPGGEAAEPTHRIMAARIGVEGAAQICNPPANVTITLTCHIVNEGPVAGQATCGRWHLHNGATVVANEAALSVSVGGFRDMSITGSVPWADLLAGNVHIAMDLETAHFGLKSWTCSAFAVTVTPTEVEPCDTSTGETTPFLRAVVTDCATGETVSTTDTSLDGTPYMPAGTVTACSTADSGTAGAELDFAELCDVQADGTVTAFIRDYSRDEGGAITGHTDYALDGTAYAPTGTVGLCSEVLSRPVVTELLCDTAGATNTYADLSTAIVPPVAHGEPAISATAATYMLPATTVDDLWDPAIGLVNVPTWSTDPGGFRVNAVSARVTSPGPLPCGTPASVRVRVTLRYTNTGPTSANFTDPETTLSLRNGSTILQRIDYGGAGNNGVSQGESVLRTVEAVVPWADVQAGNITWYWSGVVYQGPNNRKNWRLDQYDVEITDAAPIPGCGETTPFLRHYTVDPDTGTAAHFDTTLDGEAYTAGEAVLCATSTTDTEEPTPDAVSTGVRSVTGATVQDLVTEFATLQSVSLAVLAGTVNVTMNDGTDVAIPAGVTLTWSVSKDSDDALAAASFTGADGTASYLLNWTYLS